MTQAPHQRDPRTPFPDVDEDYCDLVIAMEIYNKSHQMLPRMEPGDAVSHLRQILTRYRESFWVPITSFIPSQDADPNHPLLLFDPDLIDEDFNPTGTVIGHYSEELFCPEPDYDRRPSHWVAPIWDNDQDCFWTHAVHPTFYRRIPARHYL